LWIAPGQIGGLFRHDDRAQVISVWVQDPDTFRPGYEEIAFVIHLDAVRNTVVLACTWVTACSRFLPPNLRAMRELYNSRKTKATTVAKHSPGCWRRSIRGSTDSVYVMVVEDGEDIAGMGGLMGTAMSVRGYAGAVIDGGVRDVAYLRKIAFPVFATGIVSSIGASLPVWRGADSAGVQRSVCESG
jgi:hypothetical protein